jgi:hypothetical protein
MNEDGTLKARTLEMLEDTLYFERNINDSRLADFQKCFQESVNMLAHKAGYESREEMLKGLEELSMDEFWAIVQSLNQEIHTRVDSRMNIMTELFFKGDEIDQVSRVFFQSTFQRIRRMIATAKGENVKIISEILYRLIILSVLCQYRENSFKEAVL